MPQQKPPDKGTTVVTDPVPDSELHPEKFQDDELDAMLDLGTSTEAGEGERKAKGVTEVEKKNGEEEKEEPVKDEGTEKVEDRETEKVPDTKVTESVESVKADYEKKLSDSQAKISELEEKNKGYENIKAALEELKNEPAVFFRKYAPQLAEKYDPRKAIISKLREEFGADFLFDAAEAYQEGTKSYQWRLREEELRDNLQRELRKADLEAETSIRDSQARFNEAKKKVMADRKLTDAQFDELANWAKTVVVTPEHWAILKYRDDDIKKAVDAAISASKKRKTGEKPEVGANDLRGEASEESGELQHIKELQDTFGDIA